LASSTTRPSPSPAALPYVPALDGLRAVAVLVVMAQHATWVTGGAVGVYVFFALSGYLITSLLLSEHRARGTIDLARFYRRRALRLLPVLVALVLVVTAYARWAPDPLRQERTLDDTPWVLAYGSNWARIYGEDGALGLYKHTWSLAVEEQFYLLWPLLLIAALAIHCRSRSVALVALLGVGLSLATRFSLPYGDDSYARIYNGLDTQGCFLLMGCCLAAVLHASSGNRSLRLLIRRVLGVLFWPMVAVLAASVWLIPHMTDSPALRLLAAALVVACTVVVGHVAVQGSAGVARVLSWRPLTEIGKRSYGLYVWHYPIFLVASHELDGSDWKRPVQFGLSLAAAWASYRYLEKPFLRLKARSDQRAQTGAERAHQAVERRTVERRADAAIHRCDVAVGLRR
jgi:peptidoglycan/LPS O-acetylase OafA/YrhL